MPDTETKDLATLLREISELAPEVFHEAGMDMQIMYTTMVKDDHGRNYGIGLRSITNLDRAIIQAALQEACRERGWNLNMQDRPEFEETWCEIEHVPDEVEVWVEATANDPATALALAFKNALKAEA